MPLMPLMTHHLACVPVRLPPARLTRPSSLTPWSRQHQHLSPSRYLSRIVASCDCDFRCRFTLPSRMPDCRLHILPKGRILSGYTMTTCIAHVDVKPTSVL